MFVIVLLISFLLFFLIVFLFLIIMHFSTIDKTVIVLMYENTDHPFIPIYVSLLQSKGYLPIRLGQGETWQGFGTKILSYQNYFRKVQLSDDQIVVISDARDVFVNQSKDLFLNKFLQINKQFPNQLIFSTERGCCTHPTENAWKISMEQRHTIWKMNNTVNHENDFKYLNSGLIVGKVKDFRKIYNSVVINEYEDDQSQFVKYFVDFPRTIYLDYEQLLFSNAHIWDEDNLGCFYTYDKDKLQFKNTLTSTYPSFIQTPAKFWNCYNRLYHTKEEL